MTTELLSLLKLRKLSSDGSDRIVTSDEAASWPGGTVERLSAEGLLEEIEPASTIECDECVEGHVELVQVVEEPPGSPLRHYIACPVAGRVAVSPARLKRWQIVADALQEEPGGTPRRAATIRGFEHSEDFRWVSMSGKSFTLTKQQAKVVQFLFDAARQGRAEQSWARIASELALSTISMSQVFKGQRRWKELIHKAGRDVYRLGPPA